MLVTLNAEEISQAVGEWIANHHKGTEMNLDEPAVWKVDADGEPTEVTVTVLEKAST